MEGTVCMNFFQFSLSTVLSVNGGGENKRACSHTHKIGKRLPQRVVWLQQKLAHFSLSNEPTTLQKLPSVIAGNRRRMKRAERILSPSGWQKQKQNQQFRSELLFRIHRRATTSSWMAVARNEKLHCATFFAAALQRCSAFFYLLSLCLIERRGKLIRTGKGAHCFKALGLWMDLTFCRRPIPAAGLANFYPARAFLQWLTERRKSFAVYICAV